MSKREEILRDMQGFIEFCIKNNEALFYCLGNLGHDIQGLFSEEGTFTPRTKGYKKFLEEEK